MLDKRVKDCLEDITFGEYAEVVCGDAKCLAIAGDCSFEELEKARKFIMYEFAETSGNFQFASDMHVNLKLAQINLKLIMLGLASIKLTNDYSESTFEMLKDLNIISKKTKYPTTPEELNSFLESLRIKTDLLKLDSAELEGKEKQKEETQVKRKDFTRVLAAVSMFVKFNVGFDTNAALVAEYINRLREHNEAIERSKLKK